MIFLLKTNYSNYFKKLEKNNAIFYDILLKRILNSKYIPLFMMFE